MNDLRVWCYSWRKDKTIIGFDEIESCFISSRVLNLSASKTASVFKAERLHFWGREIGDETTSLASWREAFSNLDTVDSLLNKMQSIRVCNSHSYGFFCSMTKGASSKYDKHAVQL